MYYARLLGLLICMCLLPTLAPTARAQTFNTLTVATTSVSGSATTSLPYLLGQANGTSTPTRIIFDSALDGMTITPTARLTIDRNIRLLAQDADGMPVDITLDGSSVGNTLIAIRTHTATVAGFTMNNLTGQGILIRNLTGDSCQANARMVTVTDNVLVAAGDAQLILVRTDQPNPTNCPTMTISDNDISQTAGTNVDGIAVNHLAGVGQTNTTNLTVSGNTISTSRYAVHISPQHNTSGGMATSSVTALVSGNTITGGETGIRIESQSLNTGIAGGTMRLAATLSDNRITGADDGIRIYGQTDNAGSTSQIAATLSRNYITGADFGLTIRLRPIPTANMGAGTNTITLSGTDNTIIDSRTIDIYASEYGQNGHQVGRSGYDVRGGLENTIYTTRNIRPNEGGDIGLAQRRILLAYQAAFRRPPGGRFWIPPAWPQYRWPESLDIPRYEPAAAPAGTISDTDYRLISNISRSITYELIVDGVVTVLPRFFTVVSTQATTTTLSTNPYALGLFFREEDPGEDEQQNVINLRSDQLVTVCLPTPPDLSNAPNLQLAWKDGNDWRPLSLSYQSGDQICVNLSGFPAWTEVPFVAESPPGGGRTVSPPPEPTVPVGFLENPQPDSFQSGIGLISGWECYGELIEFVIEVEGSDTTHRLQASSGTGRADVAAAGRCEGRADVGFGLLFNWNLLGDGEYTIRALSDGVEFDRATFTVTTLGQEFLVGVSGATRVIDFPSPGEQARLIWQQSLQNFMLAPLPVTNIQPVAGQTVAQTHMRLGVLENPSGGSFQSGISLLSGWVCEAERVELEINGIHRLEAASGTGRADTADYCGNEGNNGFGLLFNWNLLGDGLHTVRALADGVEFGRATFRVTTLGEEFILGASGEAVVDDFPNDGESVTLTWQQSSQNFVISNFEQPAPVEE